MYVMPAQDVQTYVKFLGITDNSQKKTKQNKTQTTLNNGTHMCRMVIYGSFPDSDPTPPLISFSFSPPFRVRRWPGSHCFDRNDQHWKQAVQRILWSEKENKHTKNMAASFFRGGILCVSPHLNFHSLVSPPSSFSVGAHLHSPYDFNFYVQNFTVRWTSNLLPPQSEVTVEYKFRPDEKLEPLDFHLSGWLIYNDSSSTPIIYRSLFFNQTIEVTERRSEWTFQSLLTSGLVLAGIAIVGYVVLSQTNVGKKAAKRVTASTASAEQQAASWDTKIYKPSTVQKSVGSKKAAQKSK